MNYSAASADGENKEQPICAADSNSAARLRQSRPSFQIYFTLGGSVSQTGAGGGGKKYFFPKWYPGTVGRSRSGTAYAKIRCPRFFSFMRK